MDDLIFTPKLRLVSDPEPVRTRGMDEVAKECRAREASAMRTHRVADAALYAEVAERAEAVAAKERAIGYAERTVAEDEARRAKADLVRWTAGLRFQRVLTGILLGLVLFAVLLITTGCGAVGPKAGTLEAYTGGSQVTAQGPNDVADVGGYGIVGLSGSVAEGDALTGAAGEWWVEQGSASGEVDAGALGLFDLEADVLRAGLGLRLGTRRALGLDWTLGLGACLTIVSGDATAGPLHADVKESGLGAYAAGTVGRGPFFLRATYITGPEVEVQDEPLELGGMSVVGGLRWSF